MPTCSQSESLGCQEGHHSFIEMTSDEVCLLRPGDTVWREEVGPHGRKYKPAMLTVSQYSQPEKRYEYRFQGDAGLWHVNPETRRWFKKQSPFT
jgi:hypothetical protein